jgi:hypothetical protein
MVVALFVSNCNGSTSEPNGSTSEPKESASSKPANTPPGQLLDWSDVDLEKNMSRIGYGAKPGNILARGSDGGLVFNPETPKDHIATPFVDLPAHSGDRSLELSLDMKIAGGESCVAILQDQAYNVLATLPCQTAGAHQTSAKVSSPVKSVRVYFQSAARQPIPLPTRMRLSEQR